MSIVLKHAKFMLYSPTNTGYGLGNMIKVCIWKHIDQRDVDAD